MVKRVLLTLAIDFLNNFSSLSPSFNTITFEKISESLENQNYISLTNFPYICSFKKKIWNLS
jgi:hypothetical protein